MFDLGSALLLALFARKPLPEQNGTLKIILREEGQRERIRQRIRLRAVNLPLKTRNVLELRYAMGDGHVYTAGEVEKILRLKPEEFAQLELEAVLAVTEPILREWMQPTE